MTVVVVSMHHEMMAHGHADTWLVNPDDPDNNSNATDASVLSVLSYKRIALPYHAIDAATR
jgi:hypothetical protein